MSLSGTRPGILTMRLRRMAASWLINLVKVDFTWQKQAKVRTAVNLPF
jgi:hypothetical protein